MKFTSLILSILQAKAENSGPLKKVVLEGDIRSPVKEHHEVWVQMPTGNREKRRSIQGLLRFVIQQTLECFHGPGPSSCDFFISRACINEGRSHVLHDNGELVSFTHHTMVRPSKPGPHTSVPLGEFIAADLLLASQRGVGVYQCLPLQKALDLGFPASN